MISRVFSRLAFGLLLAVAGLVGCGRLPGPPPANPSPPPPAAPAPAAPAPAAFSVTTSPPEPDAEGRTIRIYGHVVNPCWIILGEARGLKVTTVLQAAGGPSRTADVWAEVVRREPNGTVTKFELNLRNILRGTDPDVTLFPGDILYVREGLIGGT